MNVNISQNSYKKLILIGIFVLFFASIFITITTINNKGRLSDKFDSQLAHNVVFEDKDDSLYGSTIPRDYMAFQDRMRDFVTNNDGAVSSNIVIKSVYIPTRELSSVVKVTLDIPSLGITDMLVVFDYNANTFSIPSKNYNVPLYGTSYN